MTDKKSKDWHKFKEENDNPINDDADSIDDLDEDKEQASETAASSLSVKELQQKLAEVEQQSQENWEKSVRAVAEVKNAQRRADMEIEKALRFGLEKFVDSLLSGVDSLEQALQLAEKEQQTAMVEGLTLTLKLFLDALKKQGVEQLNPEGDEFDPELHEAMSIQDMPDKEPNTVAFVIQKGYKLNGRIVRPARVIVTKTN